MRKLIAAVGFILASFLSGAGLHAQETTFTVGTAGNVTATSSDAGNISGETISTEQIDSLLRLLAPGTFGQNFTRDKANKAFADFTNLRVGLSASLAQTIAAQTNIRRVNSVAINTPGLRLRLSQKTNSVSGELGTIMASVSLVADVDGIGSLFCPSANVSFNVNNIRASGDYNYISGDISNATVNYDVTDVSASCNGLLGFIGDAFGNPSATARNQINNAIQSQLDTQLAFINMKRLFSLADFANGLRYYGDNAILSLVANRAIGIFRELVNDAAINTPGIVLDFRVTPATTAGSNNAISILASHATVDVINVNRTIPKYVDVTIPPNTERVDLYYRTTGNWTYFASGTSSRIPYTNAGPRPEIMAIGRNGTFSGLESFPGRIGYPPDPLGWPGTKK
jgi:hypothetical protein